MVENDLRRTSNITNAAVLNYKETKTYGIFLRSISEIT